PTRPIRSAHRLAWSRLAARAAERGPVHEMLAADRRAAAPARFAGPAVRVERPVEVTALPVDVDVQRVEAGPAGSDGFAEHVAHVGEQPPYRRPGQLICCPGTV